MKEELICRICKWTGDETDAVHKTFKEDGVSPPRFNIINICPVCGSSDVDDADVNPYDMDDDGDLLR